MADKIDFNAFFYENLAFYQTDDLVRFNAFYKMLIDNLPTDHNYFIMAKLIQTYFATSKLLQTELIDLENIIMS